MVKTKNYFTMIQTFRDFLFQATRWFWLVCGLFFWLYWLASLPRFVERATTGTLPATLVEGLVPAQVAADGAAAWGTTVGAWAWINLFTNGLAFLVFSIVSLLIWWKLRTSFGLLTAYVLLLGGSNFMNNAIYSAELSATALIIWELGAIIWPFFILWLYLFPNGRAVPRTVFWIFVPLLTLFALLFIFYLASSIPETSTVVSQTVNEIQPLFETLIPILLLIVVGAQIYRYGRMSTLAEKKQTRWFLFGLVIALLIPMIMDIFIQYPAEIGTLTFAAIPLGIGISILRYRLYDIDLIIRKTLQYTLLTGLLALVYFGSVVLLQSLTENLFGEQSPLVIVFSTLVVAALFNPLRIRIQDFIDRRFYRKKYNAEQALSNFADITRDEVELEGLQSALLALVGETMQPMKLSLMLPDGDQSQGKGTLNGLSVESFTVERKPPVGWVRSGDGIESN